MVGLYLCSREETNFYKNLRWGFLVRERGREGEARFVDKLVWPMRLVGFQRFGKNLFGFFFLFFLRYIPSI